MTKISLNRLEASIAELEAGKGVVPRAELEALQAQADKLAEALDRIDEASNHYAMTPTYSEGTLRYAHQSTRNIARAALAGYQAHKEGK